jgi:hypothetical protein
MAEANIKELRDRLEELSSFHDKQYDEIPGWDGLTLECLTENAMLLLLDGKKYWFPFSQLRTVDKEVVASKWILAQKGLL